MKSSFPALVISAALGLCVVFVATPAAAGRPALYHAQPLHGHNPLLAVPDNGDDQTAVSGPDLAALCQSFLGKPNPYAPIRRNVDLIAGDAPMGPGSQAACASAQNETTVAVDPLNPLHLVAGANDYRGFNPREGRNDASGWAYASFDGGVSWADVRLPHLTLQGGATGALSDMDAATDPAIAIGPDGTVYYASLVISRLNSGTGVVVSASRDGGLHWGEPSIVRTDGVNAGGQAIATGFSNDKTWLAVDPGNGTIYVTWTLYHPNGTSPIVVSRSTDGGHTWSAATIVNPVFTPGGITHYSQGSSPVVASDGTLYIAYEASVCQSLHCNQPTDHDAVIVARSQDRGATFVNTEIDADFGFPLNRDTGRPTLSGENFRVNSHPQLAIDRKTDRLYLAWADDRRGLYDAGGNSLLTNGDVFLVSSEDGRKWSEIHRLGSDADEVFPAVAAYDGRVVVSFYTRSFDPAGRNLDYAYVAAGNLEGLERAPIRRITTQSSDPQIQFVSTGVVTGTALQGVFIGDYTAVAMGIDRRIHPVWTDFRGHPGVTDPNQDIDTETIPFPDDGDHEGNQARRSSE